MFNQIIYLLTDKKNYTLNYASIYASKQLSNYSKLSSKYEIMLY